MSGILYTFAESTVSLGNTIITFTITIIIAAVIGILFGSFRKSVLQGFISAVLVQLIAIVLFFSIRDKVQEYRLNEIKNVMSKIEYNQNNCVKVGKHINHWKEGLELIEKCPSEVGYYIITVDLIASDKDYESAATLIEYGLDFIQIYPPPEPLCERLQSYYKHLKKRPELNSDCVKFHRF